MADNTYTNISDLPTLDSVSSDTWAPVEISGKVGKKVDLAGLTEQSIENMATTDEMTPEEKAAFLGNAYIPVKGTDSVKNVALADIVPDTVVRDANYVHTDNNFTTTEKNKLNGIAAGAEVNVQSDWNATNGDAFIKNKPTIPSADNKTIVSNNGVLKIAGYSSTVENYYAVPHTYGSNGDVKWARLPYHAIENTPTLVHVYRNHEYDPEYRDSEGHYNLIGTPFRTSTLDVSPSYHDGMDGPNGTGGATPRDNPPIIDNGEIVLFLPDDVTCSRISFKDPEAFPWKEVANGEAPDPGYVYCKLSDLTKIIIVIPAVYEADAYQDEERTDSSHLYQHTIELVKIDGQYTVNDFDVEIYYQQRNSTVERYYDGNCDEYEQLTCVSSLKKINPHKPGIIRITGLVYEILQ